MRTFILAIFLLVSGILQAQDRLFTYTYQSTVLNRGQRELEIWNSYRSGRDSYYGRLDSRAEFEIGLGKNIQTAFYLNSSSKTGIQGPDSALGLQTSTELGFSNEWKLKILDPVANSFGMALYGEYGISSSEFELEGKLILDKRINKFTLAANAVYELELEPEPEFTELEWEKEHKADLNLAVAYSLTPVLAFTSEHALRNVFADGSLEHSALYSGLGISYILDKFWLNCTVLPQVKSFKGQDGKGLNLQEFEKIQYRILFSYVF